MEPKKGLLEAQNLPRNYEEALREQLHARDTLLRARQNSPNSPTLGFLFAGEHDPVYTIGRHGNPANLLVPESTLHASLVRTDRGGDITYHGPGQLVLYPILDLARLGIGPRHYVLCLLNATASTLKKWGIQASTRLDDTGVWIKEKKICAIGLHITHGICMHGIALNVSTDLNAFTKINPCGFNPQRVTSMEREVDHPLQPDTVRPILANLLSEQLGLQLHFTDPIHWG